MACSQPFLMIPKNKNNFYTYKINPTKYYVPCGYCLNCRVDKRNQLQDRCEQELINYKCGTFLTVTYDDYHIIDLLRHDEKGNLNATLSKKDTKQFLDRLRHNIKNNMPDNLLCNHKFKYLVVGEYGGDGQIFDRPHMHFLFFGLDFAYCKKQFERAWQGRGMIKILPILNGGISYVLKYLDKQLFGNQAFEKYTKNNIEKPFQNHSIGLGNSLYKNQLDYIKKSNGSYRWKGKERPVPHYYKNKYLIASDYKKAYQDSKDKYKIINGSLPKNQYDLHDFKIQQNILREQNLNHKIFMSGRPMYFNSHRPLSPSQKEYVNSLAAKCLNLTVPF